MKHYDPKAVEALLKNIWKQEISTPLSSTDIFYFAAAVRDSAREEGEVSDDDKRRLVEEVQRKWSIDGGASERDSPLSFARECIDAALARFAAPRGGVARCRWAEDSDGTWETACGKVFIVIEGRPDENDMAFCCYCGGCIEQADYSDAPPRGEEG